MMIYNLLFNKSIAECLLNLFAHIVLLSAICWTVIFFFRKYSIGLRENLASAAVLSVITASVLSVIFISTESSWIDISMFDSSHKKSEMIESPVNTIRTVVNSAANTSLVPVNFQSETQSKRFPWKQKHYYGIINILGFLWFAGFTICLIKLFCGLTHIRKLKGMLKNPHLVINDNIRKSFSQVFNTIQMPEVRISNLVSAPLAIGLLKPVIVIPENLYENISEDELKSIIFHEYGHIHRKDNFTGLSHRLLLTFYWWNPVIRWICNQYAVICENICDEYAVRGVESAPLYSKCLLNLAKRTSFFSEYPAAASMASNGTELKQRIKNILTKEGKMNIRTGKFAKSATQVSMLAITLLIACTGVLLAETKNNKTELQVNKTESLELAIKSKDLEKLKKDKYTARIIISNKSGKSLLLEKEFLAARTTGRPIICDPEKIKKLIATSDVKMYKFYAEIGKKAIFGETTHFPLLNEVFKPGWSFELTIIRVENGTADCDWVFNNGEHGEDFEEGGHIYPTFINRSAHTCLTHKIGSWVITDVLSRVIEDIEVKDLYVCVKITKSEN